MVSYSFTFLLHFNNKSKIPFILDRRFLEDFLINKSSHLDSAFKVQNLSLFKLETMLF